MGRVRLRIVLVVVFFRRNCVVLACIAVSAVGRSRVRIVWEVLYRILSP